MARPTIAAFKVIILAMLKADSTLRGESSPLIASDDDIVQYHDKGKLFDAATNTLVTSPALLVCWTEDKWSDEGDIYDRDMNFTILVLVSEATFTDRAADSDPIVDAVYACLVGQELSGLAGSNGRIKAIGTRHIAEVQDEEGNPIEMSGYEMRFKCGIEWQ